MAENENFGDFLKKFLGWNAVFGLEMRLGVLRYNDWVSWVRKKDGNIWNSLESFGKSLSNFGNIWKILEKIDKLF